jgi:hypothetical protein
MQDHSHFFCVGCCNMVQLDDAAILFRTGFYRVIHPMGCCETCSKIIADSHESTTRVDIGDDLHRNQEYPGASFRSFL